MRWHRPMVCLLAVVVALAGLPLGASAAVGGQAGDTTEAGIAQTTSNESVNVSVGQQLSTVLSTTSDDVQSEVEATEFELEVEDDSDEARAEAIAARADRLSDRAESIREDYEDATEAYEDGELSKSEYAQRIATLNARAENVVTGIEQLEQRSGNVSEVELRAAGLNRTALQAASEDLDSVRGSGAKALLQRFTGTSTGEIEIETTDGFSVEVSGEDGEFSREIDRPRDDDNSISITQSTALGSARNALSAPQNATWAVQKASVHEESGYYRFEFGFATADRTGEAEIRVDGSSGDVFRVEEEIEPTDEGEEREDEADEGEEDDEREDDEREDDELALIVADGTVASGETITVRALRNGEPASNVTVSVNGETVGTTDADGTVALTLPSTEEVEIAADEGELELALESGEDDEDDIYRNLRADTTVTNGTATVTVTYNGSGVDDAVVSANDREVGTTDGSGTVTFAVPDGAEELDIEIVKGEFEAEFEYELRDGELVQTDGPDAGDEEIEDDEETEEAETEDDEAETEADEGTEKEAETDDEEDETEEETDDEEETEDDETEDDD